jgi:cyclopentanol dehydrogenase
MKRVENKVILVTGGAMGMGRSHSELLAAQGAWVFVADVNAAEGQATVDSTAKTVARPTFCSWM